MAVTIRLARHGRSGRPYYHIVAADRRDRRDGRFLDKIGTYNPVGAKGVDIDLDKARTWLGHGATVSNVVRGLFKKAGVYETPAATSAE